MMPATKGANETASSRLLLDESFVSLLELYLPLESDGKSSVALRHRARIVVGAKFERVLNDKNATSSIDLNMTSGFAISSSSSNGRSVIGFDVSPFLDVSTSTTLAFWLNVSRVVDSEATLLAWSGAVGVADVSVLLLAVDGGKKFAIDLRVANTSVAKSTVLLTKNMLTHVALVIDALQITWFINGVESSRASFTNVAPILRKFVNNECTETWKHNCVRMFVIGAARTVEQPKVIFLSKKKYVF